MAGNPFGANNTPVGSAGQPADNSGKGKPTFQSAIKKQIPEGKKAAIQRRMAKNKAADKK